MIVFKNYDSLIAALIGFYLILMLTTPAGVGISPDSIVYTSAARSLASDGILQTFNDRPLVDFPCFYPIFLYGCILLTRMDIIVFAPYLNAVLFGLLIFTCGYAIQKYFNSTRIFKSILLACLLISPVYWHVFPMLWSETLFIVLITLFCITIHSYFKTYSIRFLLISGALAALCCITRYAGITIVATGASLLLLDRNVVFKQRFLRAILFGCIGFSLLTINLIYNYSKTSFLTGYRQKGITSFWSNLSQTASEFCDWVFVFKIPGALKLIPGILVLFLLGRSFLKPYFEKKKPFSFNQILSLFALIYLIFLLLISTLSHFQNINTRLLSPAYLSIFLTGSYTINIFLKTALRSKPFYYIISAGIILLFLSNEIKHDTITYNHIRQSGIDGYSDYSWRQSGAINYIRKNKSTFDPEFYFYSNANEALYYFCNLKADLVPHKSATKEIEEFVNEGSQYLVWFKIKGDKECITMDYILRRKNFRLLQHFEDADLFIYHGSNH